MSDKVFEHDGRRYRVEPLLDRNGEREKWEDGSDKLSVFDEETGELDLGLTIMHNPYPLEKLGESMKKTLDKLVEPPKASE